MSSDEVDKNYLEKSVRTILQPLVQNIINIQPKDHVRAMIEWLNNYLGNTGNENDNTELNELLTLRKEIRMYRKKYPNIADEDEEKIPSDDEEDRKITSEEQAKIDAEQAARKKKNKGIARTSVSAEVHGTYNKKEAFVPRVISKTDEQKARIRSKMNENFLFNSLDDKEFNTVLDSFEVKNADVNETIITQGDNGDVVFLIDSGDLDCSKKINGVDTFLKTYHSGESFGELALLYNAPRAATIIAKTPAVLYSLDRACFNAIVKSSAMNKREKYEKVLKGVEILQTVDAFELGQICDSLKVVNVKSGSRIIKQNEEGNVFYILEEGTAYATKNIEGDKEEKVLEYKSGGYFGELALLKNEPRAANVYAETDCKLITVDRQTFKRLLGPLQNILLRNSDAYTKYVN